MILPREPAKIRTPRLPTARPARRPAAPSVGAHFNTAVSPVLKTTKEKGNGTPFLELNGIPDGKLRRLQKEQCANALVTRGEKED